MVQKCQNESEECSIFFPSFGSVDNNNAVSGSPMEKWTGLHHHRFVETERGLRRRNQNRWIRVEYNLTETTVIGLSRWTNQTNRCVFDAHPKKLFIFSLQIFLLFIVFFFSKVIESRLGIWAVLLWRWNGLECTVLGSCRTTFLQSSDASNSHNGLTNKWIWRCRQKVYLGMHNSHRLQKKRTIETSLALKLHLPMQW